MSKQMVFSVLSYYPSLLANENINVGIAFQDLGTLEIRFEHIRKWQRVERYDDELDMDMFKLAVGGVKTQLEQSMINSSVRNLRDFTRHFVNELKFGQLQTMEMDEFEEAILLVKKIHLSQDYDKHERLVVKDEIKYLRDLYKSKDCEYSSKPINGKYNENIHFDFVVNNHECVKLVKITDGNINKLIHHVKSWAFTCKELSNEYKISFVISDEDLVNKSVANVIRSILSECDAKVVDYSTYARSIHSNQCTMINH